MDELVHTITRAWEKRSGPIVFTTVDQQRVPNSIYVLSVYLDASGDFCIADNYFYKTKKNIQQNSLGSLLFITEEGKSYQIKGTLTYHTEGSVYEFMKKWTPPKFPMNAATRLHVTHIYSGSEEIFLTS
ncbi:MAG: pyridoxamine 5'-phosphate oxidase family protein [Sphaerochaetaceae bacterium]|jgi:predicted pyridoxine 5'-phosphate oxidase superfamily flavin-nucleotide-binding protein